MTNQSTIDKLIEMRLTTMADAFRNQLDDPKFKEVPFEDRLGMLVDIEYSNRKNNRQKRYECQLESEPRARLILSHLCSFESEPPKHCSSNDPDGRSPHSYLGHRI